jgi:hypothetical protein
MLCHRAISCNHTGALLCFCHPLLKQITLHLFQVFFGLSLCLCSSSLDFALHFLGLARHFRDLARGTALQLLCFASGVGGFPFYLVDDAAVGEVLGGFLDFM